MSWETQWESIARRLALNYTRRVKCCGMDNSRTIRNLADRYITGCFRCKETKVVMKDGFTALRDSARTADAQRSAVRAMDFELLPVEDMSTHAVAWLLGCRVKEHHWLKYNIRQDGKTGKVIVPITVDAERVGVVARNVHGGTPKYINHNTAGFGYLPSRGQDTLSVVVVEDWMSAIRVHEATQLAVLCNMGTGSNIKARNYIAQKGLKRVVLWFDADEAGRLADNAWTQEMRALGLSVCNVETPDDPKDYDDNAIRNYIKEVA